MTSVSGGFINDVKSFASNHITLCVLTLGLAVVGFSIKNLGGRAYSWIRESLNTTKKTDDVANQVFKEAKSQLESTSTTLNVPIGAASVTMEEPKVREITHASIAQEIAHAPFAKNSDDLTYLRVADIEQKNGIFLTKNRNPYNDGCYVGIVALPVKDGYCLHLSPGGGNMFFDRDQVYSLMSEAIETLVEKGIKITNVAQSIGRHPGATMEHFKAWQADQLKS